MNDLQSQIRGYGAQLIDEQQPITTAEALATLESVRTLPVQPLEERRRPPVWIAAVAAAVVLIAIGLGAALLNGTDSTPPATEPATSTTSPQTTTTSVPATTTTTVETTALAPPSVSWEAVSFQPGEGPQHGHIRAGTDQLLVLQPGYEGFDQEAVALVDVDGDPRTILWTSQDGHRWEEHVLEQFEASRPALVGEAHGTYVLHYWDDTGYVNYLSTDLVEWTVWDIPESTRDGRQPILNEIAANENAVVGYGWDTIVRADPGFTNTEIVEAPFGEAGDGGVLHLVATADTFYALVYSNSTGRSTVWSSPDGTEWVPEIDELPSNPPDSEGREIAEQYSSAIATNNDRVLSYIDRGRASGGPFWSAASGEPLQRVGGPQDPGEVTLVATADGFLVGYTSGFGEGAIGPTHWYITADGSTWERAAGAPGQVGLPAAVGNAVLLPTGRWVIEYSEEGFVASESWQQDGGWILGTTEPGS